MVSKRARQGDGGGSAGSKHAAKTRFSVGGDTRITVTVPSTEAGTEPAGPDLASYPPSAVLKVEGNREYEIARLVARGGMGVIYEAKDRSCERFVAVKLMNAAAGDKDEVGLFIQEAKITSQLEHPNIVPVHELGNEVGGMAYYTMKYVQGVTLTDVLKGLHAGKLDVIERFQRPGQRPHVGEITSKQKELYEFMHAAIPK